MEYLYRHFDCDGRLLYVGISNCVPRRTDQHKKKATWFDKISKIEIQSFVLRCDAVVAEMHAIKNESPQFNVEHSLSIKRKQNKMPSNDKASKALLHEWRINHQQKAKEIAILRKSHATNCVYL